MIYNIMLTTYLNNQPYSNFVLIEDSLVQPGKDILKYIVGSHIKAPGNHIIHYFVFEGNFEKIKNSITNSKVRCYDFVTDSKGWLNADAYQDFSTTVSGIKKQGSIIVINSLAHAIFQSGVDTVYKTLRQLLADGVTRIVTILHQDLCEHIDTAMAIEHLASFVLTLQPKFNSKHGRILYVYKKAGGKIIKKIEEFKFENGILKTELIKPIDPKLFVQENLNEIEPENLSTFRISLNETEKESRDQLILPYLPKESKEDDGEAKIFYQFDSTDDWDEEDPDDDLDI